MVLNISGRTDIVAFYSKWFINRYREGYLDVRNPFYPKSVSRISFSNVDAIVFCTKNPSPLLDYIEEIKIPILLHVTITPYKEDIEPNVPKKDKIIEDLKKLSKILGKDRIVVRYDPIFLNDKYNLEYHIKAFERLCSLIDGYASKVISAFWFIFNSEMYFSATFALTCKLFISPILVITEFVLTFCPGLIGDVRMLPEIDAVTGLFAYTLPGSEGSM